jgi:hypothetical protein
VLNAGRLVEQGPVGKLRTARARMRVVVSVNDQPLARTLLARWPLRTDGPDALLVDHTDGGEVNEVLARGGVWARQIRIERAGLEEAFLHLTADTNRIEVSDATFSR